MKNERGVEYKIILAITFLLLLLIFLFHFNEIASSVAIKSQKQNIDNLEYKVIVEKVNSGEDLSISNSYVYYAAPDKLRIDTLGKTKTIEIYNGKRYVSYDNINKRININEFKNQKLPSAVEKGAFLDKIIKAGDIEFFGYEEKDDKDLMVFGVISQTEGHNVLNKYWVGKINKISVPYKEECFVDNIVVSKTTYIYLKVNRDIDKNIFNVPTIY